jgi:hypothetical protein
MSPAASHPSGTRGPDVGAATRLRISKSVYVRPFNEELVVLDFSRGEYFALDEVGARVWQHLEKGESLGAIAHAIAGEYDVTESAALADIVVLATELVTQSLVETVDPE